MASAYIDRELIREELGDYEAHLSRCQACRKHLAETERVSLTFRLSEKPDVPREMHPNVMIAVRRLSSGEATIGQRIFEFILKMNPRLVSYTTGAVVSAMLFMFTLSQFKPIPLMKSYGESTHVIPVKVVTSPQYELPASYTVPNLNEDGSLATFLAIPSHEKGDEGAAMLLQVTPAGDALILEVWEEPRDPNLIEELSRSLNKKPFKFESTQFQNAPVVFFYQKIDISG